MKEKVGSSGEIIELTNLSYTDTFKIQATSVGYKTGKKKWTNSLKVTVRISPIV